MFSIDRIQRIVACIREPRSESARSLGRARDVWPPLAIFLSSGVVIALVLLRTPAVIRAVPVLVYIAIVPGLACVRLTRLPERLSALVLGVGLSLALGTVVAIAMVYARLWSPTLGIAALGSIASIAAAVELLRHRFNSAAPRSTDRR
jgi:hypothetical protein